MRCQRIHFSGWGASIVILLFQMLPATLHSQAADGKTLASVERAFAASRGERIYTRACVPCHGVKGDGKGPFSTPLSPKPRDFTSGKFKFRTTLARSLPSDQDVFKTISEGVPGTFMPAWEDLLSERDRMDLVQYIKTFSKRFSDPRLSVEPINVSNAVPPSEVSIARGREVYEKIECIKCHGNQGRGNGPSAKDLEDDWGYALRPPDLTRSWTFKGGTAREDIYCRFMSGLSGTPMPSVAESFVLDEEVEEIQIKIEDGEEVTPEERQKYDEAMEEIRQSIWHLTNYVKSLSRKPGLFYQLFVEDTEVTKARSVKK
ncbi:MAG: c-type cytochrome [bacterium]